MSNNRLTAIACKISEGVVSDERAFEIELADGNLHGGVAPVYYFWNQDGHRIGLRADSRRGNPGEEEAARLLERQNGTAMVSIPDGSVVRVQANASARRTTDGGDHRCTCRTVISPGRFIAASSSSNRSPRRSIPRRSTFISTGGKGPSLGYPPFEADNADSGHEGLELEDESDQLQEILDEIPGSGFDG